MKGMMKASNWINELSEGREAGSVRGGRQVVMGISQWGGGGERQVGEGFIHGEERRVVHAWQKSDWRENKGDINKAKHKEHQSIKSTS